MTRVRHALIIALPSLLAGGLLFGFWPANAQTPRDPWNHGAPVPPAPPAPPAPPTPPAPPAPGTPVTPPAGGPRHGVSVSIHDGKVSVEGLTDMVRKQLDSVRDMVKDNPRIPPPVRAAVLARLERVRASVERRLSRIKSTDIEQLGEEMERVGEDLQEAMDGLDEDLGRLGKDLAKQFGKDWAKQWKKQWKGKIDIQVHDDEDGEEDGEAEEADSGPPPVDPDDARAAIADVRGISLEPRQRQQIQKLREESERQISQAQNQLAMLSSQLEEALANPRVSDEEIRRYVDNISATEAQIRKARLLAWVGARRVLDEQQRAKVEAAAKQRARRP